jgi:hypothetical protein
MLGLHRKVRDSYLRICFATSRFYCLHFFQIVMHWGGLPQEKREGERERERDEGNQGTEEKTRD